MQSDEDQIRALVARWMAATRAGDTQAVLDLMTDDAVFLVPGREPMRKAEFAAASQAQAGAGAPSFEGQSDIQEIQVCGDWAFLWSRLQVTITPKEGKRMQRSGHTLTVLRKEQGRWRLARDANLLAGET